MSFHKYFQNILSQTRTIIAIFISIAFLMIISSLTELHQSKKELLQVMEKQAHSLLEALMSASENTLRTNEFIENLAQERLFNNASLINKLYEKHELSDQLLTEIAQQNNIFRIMVVDHNGKKLFSSRQNSLSHQSLSSASDLEKILKPIFSGVADTIIIGLKKTKFETGYRYAVALATKKRGAIVLNINAQQFLTFKKHIGFGALIRNVAAENPGIIYAALQDASSILAASGNVRVLEAISQSPFLSQALNDSLFLTRIVDFDSLEVFEAVHPFTFNQQRIGLLRVGLSMQPVEDINARSYRRLLIISLILVIFGSFLLVYIFTRQKFTILQKEYNVIETYSSSIIDNVSDAIIVYDHTNGIKIFNRAAENLFFTKKSRILGQSLFSVFKSDECLKLLSDHSSMKQINCQINEQMKYLLVSKSIFHNSEQTENFILVIRDLTEQKLLEEQMARKQRLTAMGELASGVAHEIRNPLNTISTIIQQLNKDFKPAENEDEYHELAQLVYGEVRRINETVQDFLRFARPEPLQPSMFKLADLLQNIEKQYQSVLEKHHIRLEVHSKWNGKVHWDKNQMKQVFINLIQNAIEAIGSEGKIEINVLADNKHELQIYISDNGPGMDESIRLNIFNLYFTTKAQGTGIGLSIVQRIIFEHGGVISVESQPAKGTTFRIRLPLHV